MKIHLRRKRERFFWLNADREKIVKEETVWKDILEICWIEKIADDKD